MNVLNDSAHIGARHTPVNKTFAICLVTDVFYTLTFLSGRKLIYISSAMHRLRLCCRILSTSAAAAVVRFCATIATLFYDEEVFSSSGTTNLLAYFVYSVCLMYFVGSINICLRLHE
jgi:hypothetical protein